MSLLGVGDIAKLVDDGINKIWPDKTEQDKEKFALLSQQLTSGFQLQLAQIQVDQEAEKQPGWFTKGRDGALWTCVLGFFWMFFLRPVLDFVFIACGHPLTLPALDVATTQDLLGGLLGLGGMHMYQQVKGA